MMCKPAYILVDWGTSSFRLWLVDGQGTVLGESRSDEGMMFCAENGFAPVLNKHLQQVGAAQDVPVMICGMAGARQGWAEAPYQSLPAGLDTLADHALRIDKQGRDIRILPGLAQREPNAANVMRGEETQLAGLAMTMPDGLVCMPGTHSKWTQLTSGKVIQFSTYMTGELFAVLSGHSILKHAVDSASEFDACTPAFVRAAEKALTDPARVLDGLFNIRASQLLGFETHSEGAAHLSGLLIGAEIGGAKQLYGAGEVGLVVSGKLADLYHSVLEIAGFSVSIHNGETAVRQGLLIAASRLWPVAELSNSKE